jgi:signal transduction histidine kinase
MLVQTERLAVLGEIAASLAHEIRNPLVTIGGFARRLEKKLGTRDSGGKYAAIIASEVQKLEEFLEEVLLFGRDRQPRLKPVQLNEVIHAVTRLLSAKFTEESIDIVEDLSPSLPPVPADANQLHQILINLLSNAMEAMPGGGRIFIRTALDEGPPPEVTFTVTDSGGGVEPEVLGNIFNPFFTTKSGGHGLGLALTQRIVTAHSGRLSVRNHPGRGLTLGVALPLPPEPGLLKNVETVRKSERGVQQ